VFAPNSRRHGHASCDTLSDLIESAVDLHAKVVVEHLGIDAPNGLTRAVGDQVTERIRKDQGKVCAERPSLDHVELLHLRYFVAVAEELNFSAAARKLHMAASPLSQRIKDLEHELGRRLFDRSTHHVELTEAGAALLPIARDVLDRVGSIRWQLDQATKPTTRHCSATRSARSC
jgi:hypothetical protein